MSQVQATFVDRDEKTAKCPCGETIALPYENCPIFRYKEEVWYPLLVGVRCPNCRAEVRLDGEGR